MNRCLLNLACVALVSFALVAFNLSAVGAAETLLTIDADLDLSKIEKRDVQLSLGNRDGRAVLSLAAGHQQKWPGITIAPAAGAWDLAAFETLTLLVLNAGEHPVRVGLRADGPDVDGKQQYIQAVEEIAAGQQKLVRLPLQRRMPAAVRDKLFGMRGYPGQLHPDRGIDVARVIRVQCFVSQPDRDHTLEISDLQASGQYDGGIWLTAGPDRLFPMIDRFGQYMHSTWPGKTGDEDDLRRRIEAEDGELASHPGPTARNQYGGWSDGPQLEATGHFRATQRDGKWWLVDPEGRLFWSHGIDCVRWSSGTTPISDREFCFAELPAKDSPLSVFYGRASWAPHGYYQDKGSYQTYNFTGSNLYRKYGESWREAFQRR